MSPVYRGRFAPSPTGPLHFGSLATAMASFADARAASGEWLVRMEDVDGPRTVPGAAAGILQTLRRLGFQWDGEVVYQSARAAIYRQAFDGLKQRGLVYPCSCSRKDRNDDGVYPGTCRGGARGGQARAWRLRVEGSIAFRDRIQGVCAEDLPVQAGDFVVLRADAAWAYQLAVVADDAAQGITHVVRGADLLTSTPRQIYLQRLLGVPTPDYAHVPVAANSAGQKLSKQSGAPAIDPMDPVAALSEASRFLGHPVPAELNGCGVVDFWDWLIPFWSLTRIPAVAMVRGDYGPTQYAL